MPAPAPGPPLAAPAPVPPPGPAEQPTAWQPAPQPAPRPQPSPHPSSDDRHPKALTVLLLGILSTVFFPLGVAAIVIGSGARREIARGGRQGGGAMVSAGMALGAFGIVVWAAWIVLLVTG
jgi:hypothetical protein